MNSNNISFRKISKIYKLLKSSLQISQNKFEIDVKDRYYNKNLFEV